MTTQAENPRIVLVWMIEADGYAGYEFVGSMREAENVRMAAINGDRNKARKTYIGEPTPTQLHRHRLSGAFSR